MVLLGFIGLGKVQKVCEYLFGALERFGRERGWFKIISKVSDAFKSASDRFQGVSRSYRGF